MISWFDWQRTLSAVQLIRLLLGVWLGCRILPTAMTNSISYSKMNRRFEAQWSLCSHGNDFQMVEDTTHWMHRKTSETLFHKTGIVSSSLLVNGLTVPIAIVCFRCPHIIPLCISQPVYGVEQLDGLLEGEEYLKSQNWIMIMTELEQEHIVNALTKLTLPTSEQSQSETTGPSELAVSTRASMQALSKLQSFFAQQQSENFVEKNWYPRSSIPQTSWSSSAKRMSYSHWTMMQSRRSTLSIVSLKRLEPKIDHNTSTTGKCNSTP